MQGKHPKIKNKIENRNGEYDNMSKRHIPDQKAISMSHDNSIISAPNLVYVTASQWRRTISLKIISSLFNQY